MENNYFKRIEINGDVNNLPKKNGRYWSKEKGYSTLSEIDFEVNDADDYCSWIDFGEFYLLPVPSPDSVIVGPTSEELQNHAFNRARELNVKGNGQKVSFYNGYIEGARYALSQLKTVNLKDELVKFLQDLEKKGILSLASASMVVDNYLHKAEEGK